MVKEKTEKPERIIKMMNSKTARKIAMEMAQNLDWYAPINNDRMTMKRQYFQVNNDVCLEYWGKHEWEFTINPEMEKGKFMAYHAVITSIAKHVYSTGGISFSKIPSLIAKCKAQLKNVDKAFEADMIQVIVA